MIMIIGGGRLGNQIFQYAFLKNIEENSTYIISANFENLLELFDIDDKILNITYKNRYIKYFIWKILRPFLELVSNFRIFDYYGGNKLQEGDYGNDFVFKKGIVSKFKIINFGYFQSEKYFNKNIIKNKLKIKQKYLNDARRFLNNLDKKNIVFVHVRRGDYLQVGGALPKSYYINAIKYFENKIDDIHFVFLTDSPKLVEEEFKEITNKTISNNNMYVDFSIMTLCEYGIISNSTYGYWGGFLMQNRKEVVFPKYWLGFKKKRYSPIGIELSWAKEIDVY